ncbi:unnamed protein product, partial [marine sediment metagenome]
TPELVAKKPTEPSLGELDLNTFGYLQSVLYLEQPQIPERH